MKVKKILISQPEPADLEKSPYKNLVSKYGIEITFYKFFEVVGLTATEFRKSRIHLSEYTAVIFNSKNSVDHFFRLAKDLREVIPDTMKYFCATEAIALYLQNYIQYRKRKIFFGNQYFSDLIEVLQKHREEKFLFPCSDEKQTEYTKLLDKAKFKYTKATMYTSVPRDLSQFKLKDYDMICLFSPIGVRSLIKNFPNIAEENILIAAFGPSTHSALKAAGIRLDETLAPVIKRCIHTSADFEYAETLAFSEGAVDRMKELIRQGATIVTDTNMALAGINKKKLASFGGRCICFMAEEDVAKEATERGITRAAVSMERAAALGEKVIFAIGNAPTALIRLHEMMQEGTYTPAFIIGVPVGFVNVVWAKELFLGTSVPYIINRGRKGGSTIAAAICNAVLYQM